MGSDADPGDTGTTTDMSDGDGDATTGDATTDDAPTGDATTDDAPTDATDATDDASTDATENPGTEPTSCGAPGQGLEPVDCTRYGDVNAMCVFSNHCFCTEADGFECDVPSPTGGTHECEPGSSCVRTPPPIDPSQVGQVPTSCGGNSAGMDPVNCTKYGDVNATCVFSDHCMCSTNDGFECEVPRQSGGGSECQAGSSCHPTT